MPKIPYKAEKTNDEDDDYEIVSFEDFCDKSPGSKTDLLTLNDNINYRLCFEKDKTAKFVDGESSKGAELQTETSLNSGKSDSSRNVTFKTKLAGSFAPFGRPHNKTGRGLFSGVIPKPKNDGETNSRENHRYQRFSGGRDIGVALRSGVCSMGAGAAGVALVVMLGLAVWWAVCAALGSAWGEDHYRKLWERAHPDHVNKAVLPIPYDKINQQQVLPEYRYHDHNNLSTKNKNDIRKDRKSYSEMSSEQKKEVCAAVVDNMKFDCHPQKDASEEKCEKLGCCWSPTTTVITSGVPYCYYPPQYRTYKLDNMTVNKHGVTAFYTKERDSGYRADFVIARLDVRYLSDDVVQVKITDTEHKRFEVPIPEVPMVPGPISTLKYRVQVSMATLGFNVIRNADNVTVINTEDVGAVILSDKFLQISAILSSNRIYGLGEHQARLKRDLNWKTFTLFNKDTPPFPNSNGYGSHPFYMGVEESGLAHGMLLLNSNAMDVVLQPTPAITYRTIGGVLNLVIFLGPSPGAVIQQYTGIIGRPFMPPYWALGFHLCRFNYHDLNTTRHVWKTNRDAGLPFDVQWNDIDYMHTQNDFTIDRERFGGLSQFVKELHNQGMHYVLILDPGVSAAEKPGTYPPYDRGLEMDVFVKNSSGQPFIAKVWNPVSTVFPDFTHPNATTYWLEMMTDLHKKVPYDGAWIDMNEPSNFLNGQKDGTCGDEQLQYVPIQIPAVGLQYKTLCMDAKHYAGRHYDIHNLYALTEAIATNFALTEIRGKRPFVISRASFPGLGKVAGHWSGDIASDWSDMLMTVPNILHFSLFGVSMMGADICGFRGNTSVTLCKRWMQLGAFYPFARNHNDDVSIPQDPFSLGPEVLQASIKALRLRYRLLPYYYTQFWKAHVYGDTVARPLFFEFNDPVIAQVDLQFLIGPHLLISPLLTAAEYAAAHFPAVRWYNVRDGLLLCDADTCAVNEDQTVAIRSGAILPLQEPPESGPVSTTAARSAPLQLLVAPAYDGVAAGELYWDDGDSLNSYEEQKYSHIQFTLSNDELRSKVVWWGYGVPSLNNITVLNLRLVKTVTVNGMKCEKPTCDYEYIPESKILRIYTTLSLYKQFNIKWAYSKHHRFVSPRKVFRSKVNVFKVLDTQEGRASSEILNNISCKNNDCTEYD